MKVFKSASYGPTEIWFFPRERSVAEAWAPVGVWRNSIRMAGSDLDFVARLTPDHPDVLLESGIHFGVWQYRYSVRRK